MRQGNEFLRLTSTTNSHHVPTFPRNDAPWTKYAECLSLTPEEADDLFFVPFGRTNKRAKEFCSKCPVKHECSKYGLEHPEVEGVWGGLSERERKKLRKMLKVPVEETVIPLDRGSNYINGGGFVTENVTEVIAIDHFGSVGTDY